MGTTGNGELVVCRLRRSGGRGLVSVSALWYERAVALFEGQRKADAGEDSAHGQRVKLGGIKCVVYALGEPCLEFRLGSVWYD